MLSIYRTNMQKFCKLYPKNSLLVRSIVSGKNAENKPNSTEEKKEPEIEVSDWIKEIHATDKDRPPIVAKYRRQNFKNPIDRTIGILADDIRIFFYNSYQICKEIYAIFSKSKNSNANEIEPIDVKEAPQVHSNIPSKSIDTSTTNINKNTMNMILEHQSRRENVPKISTLRKILTKNRQPEIFPSYCDVVIIGAGAIGSSIAYHLKNNVGAGLNIVLVEKDLTYKEASTVLSVGGIRQQFSLPENILLSQYGMEFMHDINRLLEVDGEPPPDLNYHPHGYLTLASEKGLKQLKENLYVQNYFNAAVEYLDPKQIKKRFPWMNTDGIAAGVLGNENEGWFDPWSLLIGLRKKAISLGVQSVNAELVGFELAEPDMDRFYDGHPSNSERRIASCSVKMADGTIKKIHPAMVILATGHSTGRICYDMLDIGAAKEGIMAYPASIEPRKRYVYCFHAPKGPTLNTPLVIDPTGAYFRREGFGNMFLGGMSPPEHEEPSCDNLEVDYDYFTEKVWPILAHRVPGFNELKVQGSWAGFYEYNVFDQNGIVGFHPMFGNLMMAAGFSGHGIQHSIGVGRSIMELFLLGKYETIDLSRFHFERVHLNEPVYESGIV